MMIRKKERKEKFHACMYAQRKKWEVGVEV